MGLEQPYMSQALYNAQNFSHVQGEWDLDYEVDSMHNAINRGFEWCRTPQGQTYWEDLHRMYEMEYDERRRVEREQLRIIEEAEREEKLKEQESRRVYYSSSMFRMLSKFNNENDCRVSGSLISPFCWDNSFANYITMRGELCSYLPKGREHKVNEETSKWLRDGRQDMKPAKLARKLILESEITNRGITDADFEKFSNLVKSYISVVGDDDGVGRNIKMEVISGDAIKSAYLEDNYSKIMGTGNNLWGSCMRYENCQGYFGIYTNNPNQVQLLVAYDTERKVLGRAILWKFSDGTSGMDTIYAPDGLQESFISWAVENQYIYKASQSCHHQSFDVFNRENHRGCFKDVTLEHFRLKQYPYMDSMYYLNTNSGLLSNSDDDYTITLRCTGGGYEDNEEGRVLDINGEYIDEDDAHYICYTRPSGRGIEGYVWYENAVYAEDGNYYLEDDCEEVGNAWYLRTDDTICQTHDDEWELREDCILLDTGDSEGEYARLDDAVCLYNGEYALSDECAECEVDGKFYLIDDMELIEEGVFVANENKEQYLENLKETENA